MAGILYVVATPIGNLEDFTFRARRVLGEVDLIAAEDTRRTSKLLAHYEIRKPMVSLHEHNEFREAPRLVSRLLAGTTIAVVSDAGTPGLADPGARLVKAAREAGIVVIPIPGASAITAALSASGVDASHFVFRGFPPPKGQARQSFFESVAADPSVQVFFEAPHRIRRTLLELHLLLVERHIIVYREITKINEESVVRPNSNAKEWPPELGEFTVVVSPAVSSDSEVEFDENGALSLFSRLSSSGELSRDESVELVALKFGVKANSMRKFIKQKKMVSSSSPE